MKKVLGFMMAVVLMFSAAVFAGPFFGVNYSEAGFLDIYTGANFDVFSVKATFSDVDTQTPSIVVGFSTTIDKDAIEVEAGVDFLFEPIGPWPVAWQLDGIDLGIDGSVDLGPLFETNWDVRLNGNLGLLLDDSFTVTLTWGVGFYIEMPWFIKTVESL